MTVFYWLIPLFVVAVAIAVLPVLYGTMKHHEWEAREAALKEDQQKQIESFHEEGPVPAPQGRTHADLQDIHAEAVALLQRVEHITAQIDTESARLGARV
jgi:hypothetical protein